jgi:hypothetical protein
MCPRHGSAGKGGLLTALLLFLGAQFIYVHIVQATISGFVFFGQFPDAVTLAGIAIILTSGAAIAAYEQRLSGAR